MNTSPNYEASFFTGPLTLDQKIDLFEDRIIGWKFQIADIMINGGTDILGNEHEKGIHGSAGDKESSFYFKKGVKLVFPNLENTSKNVVDGLLNILYKDCRCRLYHAGLTSGRILLTHEFPGPIGYDQTNQSLIINPHKLPTALQEHFKSYIFQLRDKNKTVLRDNFEKRFDCL
jgi:hypothetical protein